MNFIGRTIELEKLKNLINKEYLGVGIILGRRRIGKSELIKQVLNDCKCKNIYYECKRINEKSNVESLSSIVSENLNFPKLGFNNFNDLLDYLFKLGISENIIIVLDEYPFLRENVTGLDSIIQSLVDKYRETSKAKLILLGSFVDIMNSLLEHSNPLYGRIDLSIDLKQLSYYEASKFYPNYSNEDKVRLYSVFGGIPYYNRLIDTTKTVKENIINLIASDGARLENEVEMYLNTEISKFENANQTFEALAHGYSKYSDILSQSHVTSGPTLIDVLDKLQKMEVVCKENPINQETNKKKTHYYICDNLSLFYYRYIFKNSSRLKIMNENYFYEKYINEDFEKEYVPNRFEEICKQYLIKENKQSKINPPFFKIGKYYYDNPKENKNGEFDIVCEDDNGYVFYEVKFTNKPISKNIIEKEIRQIKMAGLNCYKYGFISRSGFSCKEESNIKLITLEDIYN